MKLNRERLSEQVSTRTQGLIDIVLTAGDIINHAAADRPARVSKDGHANFATEYDSRVQAYLEEKLSDFLPEARFLGEEDGQNLFKEEYKKGWLFVIDPIDGTSNFIAGYEPFVISVGLFLDGEPHTGVIFCPGLDQVFYAEKGCGAYRNGEQIHVSQKPLSESLVGFGTSPYYPENWPETFRLAQAYMPKCVDIRRGGAAAWDFCQLAAGHLGLFFEMILNIYDYAAGILIVREAGGTVMRLDGGEVSCTGPSSVIGFGSAVSQAELILSDK